MKHLLRTVTVVTLVLTTMLSCEKSVKSPDVINSDSNVNIISEPLKFCSEDELVAAIESQFDGFKTKSTEDNFVSYYETVMQEDGYDERTNAIFSDALGSILNQDGEVIFGETLMKIGKTGVFYGPVSEASQVRRLADSSAPLKELFDKEEKSSLFDDVLLYRYVQDTRIYMCDTFGLYGDSFDDEVCSELIETKSQVVKWAQQGKKEGSAMDNEYVWPKNGDQKNKFTSNKDVANDTKIYKQNFGSYKEAGVKTKTMKKHGIFWKKFTSNVTSAVTNVMISEGGLSAALKAPVGWLDVNKTNYKGRSFMIATKVVNSYKEIMAGGSLTDAECDAALKWAKNKGASISKIEGVRYVIKDDPKNCIVHLRDIVVHKNDSKNTLIFNLKTAQSEFSTDKGIFNNLDIIKSSYRVDIMFLYGYSEYKGEIKGSILRCGRFGVLM